MGTRSDVAKLRLTGSPRGLRTLLNRHTGVEVAPGGVVHTPTGWWCGAAGEEALVLVAADLRARLHARLAQDGRSLGITVSDVGGSLACVAIVGRRMHRILAELTLVPGSGDLRSLSPYSAGQVCGFRVHLLLESDCKALLIVDAVHAVELWQALETAGRPLGLALIGLEAMERFEMFEKRRQGDVRDGLPTGVM
jgi:glycine cleavage system aminomethyltransferase T